MSAYACEPGQGSEPGIGWNIARAISCHHEVWVLTRTNNQRHIEGALQPDDFCKLRFIYYDLPEWIVRLKRGRRGAAWYYYLWQLGVYRIAQRANREIGFDIVHHVTFGRYWSPSLLSMLPTPFVWGPVGGGDTTPDAFVATYGRRGRVMERVRRVARWIGEHDPLVRMTARRAALALAATPATGRRLTSIGARSVSIFSNVGLPESEIYALARCERPPEEPIRFVSIGNLLHWKGFHLGLMAFADPRLASCEYWIVGDGPDLRRLRKLAVSLELSNRVTFLGRLDRRSALARLSESHILVHPSLHDSGGWVCAEALASGKPVVCLNLGGPGLLVSRSTGIPVEATTPQSTVAALSEAMATLATNTQLRQQMGRNAQQTARSKLTWEAKSNVLLRVYDNVLADGSHE